jgi:hypothetical protein
LQTVRRSATRLPVPPGDEARAVLRVIHAMVSLGMDPMAAVLLVDDAVLAALAANGETVGRLEARIAEDEFGRRSDMSGHRKRGGRMSLWRACHYGIELILSDGDPEHWPDYVAALYNVAYETPMTHDRAEDYARRIADELTLPEEACRAWTLVGMRRVSAHRALVLERHAETCTCAEA